MLTKNKKQKAKQTKQRNQIINTSLFSLIQEDTPTLPNEQNDRKKGKPIEANVFTGKILIA